MTTFSLVRLARVVLRDRPRLLQLRYPLSRITGDDGAMGTHVAIGPLWIRQPWILEAVAGVCFVLAAGTEVVRISTNGHHLGGYLAVALSLSGGAVGRRRMVPGVAMVSAAPLLAALLDWDPMVTWTMAIFVIFGHTLRGAPPVRLGIVIGVCSFAAVALAHQDLASVDARVAAFSCLAGSALGSGLRAHQRYWADLDRRAQDALATRESEATRRVAEERLRIARDLHDVVGHEIAVVSMHLGVAEAVLDERPDDTRQALIAARTGVQSVLRETQQILDVLRFGEAEGDRGPAPGLAGIRPLLNSFRSLGLQIEVDSKLTPSWDGLVEPAVGAALYRIVQEALTNAHRHSDGTVSIVASLEVDLEAGRLLVQISNVVLAGSRPASVGRGYGLLGMRERATTVGGRLEVDTSAGRFSLRVELPTRQVPVAKVVQA